jgi:uncharacterized protein YegP (UPF0339 family)
VIGRVPAFHRWPPSRGTAAGPGPTPLLRPRPAPQRPQSAVERTDPHATEIECVETSRDLRYVLAMRFEIGYVNHVEPRYFWRAVTDMGRILAWSENYRTKTDCADALDLLRRGAAAADVIDTTGTGEPSAQ